MPTDPTRVQAVFVAAAEITDPAARALFVAESCGGDLHLKARVEALLRAHDQTDTLLDAPLVASPDSDHAGTVAFTPDREHADTRTSAGGTDTPDDEVPLTFLTPSKRPDSLGRLGHYEVLQVLGRGGFGIVFRAFDDMLQRVVAVKVMAPQIATLSPARKRFVREAQSSAKVRHENVVQVYEVGEQPLPYLAMEFIPGETLQQKLDRNGPLEVSEILRIGRQIAEGLAAAHACDLIHRDIKPGNILLEGRSHKVKITDFGLARAADDASLTQSGVIAGTPMFMAPEQALGYKIDQRADLFSLGSVLYQMASGRPPFRAPSTLAVLKRVAEEPPRPIPEIMPETPDWLCDIITKLHAKNPDNRFQSAREVADLLADCEAKLKAKQEVKNILPASPSTVKPARRTWVVATAALLLPVIVLAVTEFAGVTHLFRGLQPIAAVTPKDDPKTDLKTPFATGSYALAFDGRSSHVSIPTLRRDDPGPVTIEAWIRADRQSRSKLIVTLGGKAWCSLSASGENWFSGDPSLQKGFVDTPVTPGWVHLAYVRDEQEGRLYLDGVAVDRSPRTKDRLGGTKDEHSWLGAGLEGNQLQYHFQGLIREIRISAVARYTENFTPANRYESDKNTLALYHCDAGQGDALQDSSGNNHHGQIVEANWVQADGAPLHAVAPFDAAIAKEHQDAWAKHLGVEPEITNSIGMKLRLIPPGKNAPRSSGKAESASPYYIGECEVTVEQFRRFVEATKHQTTAEKSKLSSTQMEPLGNGKRRPEDLWNQPGQADHPVTQVTWHDAMAFCEWLSRKEGRVYRLPTVSQWNWAALGGSGATFYFGDALLELDAHAWHSGNAANHTHPVRSKQPNPWGLFDLYGNVWELSYDWLRAGKAIDPTLAKEGPIATDSMRFFGGSFFDPPEHSTERGHGPALVPLSHLGFRVVFVGDLKLPPGKQEPLPPTYKNSIGMEFVIVPKGKSWLGGGNGKVGDKEVEIPADFYLGKYEVTQEQWEKVMGENPSNFSRTGGNKDAVKDITDADLKRFPVETVSWNDCQVFVAKLNELENEKGWVYRLPNEAEWEYACRGGPMADKADKADSAFDFYFAKPTNTLLPEQANSETGKGRKQTCKVGSYEPNRLGLYDMHGNVWEWCVDSEKAPEGASRHVFRGGGWDNASRDCRASIREPNYAPGHRSFNVGLRLARVPSVPAGK